MYLGYVYSWNLPLTRATVTNLHLGGSLLKILFCCVFKKWNACCGGFMLDRKCVISETHTLSVVSHWGVNVRMDVWSSLVQSALWQFKDQSKVVNSFWTWTFNPHLFLRYSFHQSSSFLYYYNLALVSSQ